jgi:hypothetical protein
MKNFGVDYSLFYYEEQGNCAVSLYGKDRRDLSYENAKEIFESFDGTLVDIDDKSYITDTPSVILSVMLFKSENDEFVPLEEKVKTILNLKDYLPL